MATGGRLVCLRSHRTLWQGERDHQAAAIADTPEDALAWLRADNRGELGAASLDAWEQACGRVAALAEHETDVIE